MKKIIKPLITCFYLFLSVTVLFASEVEKKSLLWKISGNGLQEDSYLFGTIHVICEDQFLMNEKIESALEASELLVLEFDMTDQEQMGQLQQLSMNPNFENIKGQFEEAQAAALDEFLKENYGAGLDQLGILKPFVLSSMVLMKSLPCDNQISYENHFIEKSKTLDLKVDGLETAKSQMEIFDKIPMKLQIDELGKMMLEEDRGMGEFLELVEAYLSEDIDTLYDLITASELFSEYGNLLLENRNRAWIPKIEELIKESSAFIAVGSGHLSSETGVIQLLRDAGYTVEAVD